MSVGGEKCVASVGLVYVKTYEDCVGMQCVYVVYTLWGESGCGEADAWRGLWC